MADTEYKLNVRNTTDDGWFNVLTETNITMVDPSNFFLGERLDEVLYELRQAILDVGGGGPGYLGEAVHVIDTTDSSSSTDELASFSTRGGMSVAKSLYVGGALGITGITTFSDDTTINGGDLFLDQDISGVVNITGDTTGDITGFVNATVTGALSANTLSITTSVNSVLVPDVDDTYNLGGAILRWANLYSTNVMATVITGALTGDVTGNVTGNVTGDLLAAITNAVGITTTGDIITVDVTASGIVDADTLTTANVGSNLIPNSGFNLGSVANEWSNLYVSQVLGATNIESTVATIGTLNATTINSSNFTGTFVGGLTGDVNATTVTATDLNGNLTGNLVGDTSQVTSGWDLVSAVGTADALDVVGGAHIGKSLTVDEKVFVGGDLTVTGSIIGTVSVVVPWGAVPESVLPDTDSAWDLGSNAIRWANVYADNIVTSSLTAPTFTGDLIGDLTSPVTVNVTNATPSSSVGTGALVIAGGVGIGDNLYVSGNINTGGSFSVGGLFSAPSSSFTSMFITGLTSSTDKDTGALVITQGGLGVEENVNIGGSLTVVGTLDVDDVVTFNAGMDVYQGIVLQDGNLVVNEMTDLNGAVDIDITGGDFDVLTDGLISLVSTGGNAVLQSTSDDVTISSFGPLGITTTDVTGDVTISSAGDVILSGTELTLQNATHIYDVTASTSTVTGALVVDGGLGVALDLWVGGTINSGTAFQGNFVGPLLGDVTGDVNGDLSGDLTKGSTVYLNNPTASTALGTGALVISSGSPGPTGSGLSVEGNIYAGGNIFVTGSISSFWQVVPSDAALLESHIKYIADSTITTVTLPATPLEGESISIHDVDGVWLSAPLMVGRNGNLIQGVASDLVLNISDSTVELVYTTTQGWKIV